MPRWRWFAPLVGLFLFGLAVQLAYELHISATPDPTPEPPPTPPPPGPPRSGPPQATPATPHAGGAGCHLAAPTPPGLRDQPLSCVEDVPERPWCGHAPRLRGAGVGNEPGPGVGGEQHAARRGLEVRPGPRPSHPDFYFEPLTNCSWAHVLKSAKLYIGPEYPGIKPSARHSLEMPVRWERLGYTWWRAQSVRYIMRPNRWFVEYLAAVNDALQPPLRVPPYSISIHVRRSDKVGSFSKGKEMDAVPLSDYMDYAERIRRMYPQATTVMLSSEDGGVFRQAQAYPNFTFLSVPEDRANLNHDQFVKRFGAVKMMEVSMLNLLLHQQCRFFIHTRKSNWCRLIDEFRLTNDRYSSAMVWVNGAPSNGPL